MPGNLPNPRGVFCVRMPVSDGEECLMSLNCDEYGGIGSKTKMDQLYACLMGISIAIGSTSKKLLAD